MTDNGLYNGHVVSPHVKLQVGDQKADSTTTRIHEHTRRYSLAPPRKPFCSRVLAALPLLLLLLLTCCVYCIVNFAVLLPKILGRASPLGFESVPPDPVRGCIFAGLFHVTLLLAMVSYMRVVWTPPGSIPSWLWSDGRESDLHSYSMLIQAVQLKRSGQHSRIRCCRKCRAFKPDRAHHCHECGRCALQMQYHSWLCNNCIGFYNYKFYLLWLLYSCLGCITVVVLLAPHVIPKLKSASVLLSRDVVEQLLLLSPPNGTNVVDLSILLVFAVNIVAALASLCYICLHFRLIWIGKTYHEWRKPPATKALDPRQNYHDYGPLLNFTYCFGEYPGLWLVPTLVGIQSNGIFYAGNLNVPLDE